MKVNNLNEIGNFVLIIRIKIMFSNSMHAAIEKITNLPIHLFHKSI
jgi:hypothetical protein